MLRALAILFGMFVITALVGAGGVVYVFYHFGRGLPDYHQLADYEPPVTSRVHAGDGRLLAEYAVEKRIFVPVNAMPRRIVQAMLSAEDKKFYRHWGIDFLGVVRAALTNLRNVGTERRLVGASTITQQVAKNFLLSNELSWERKIKEVILSFRMERVLSKDRLLELYLNQIYLGAGSYGAAAAALNYFDKSLDELTIAEAAYLAALPKAPNNYNPWRHPRAAKVRRDWVLDRMTLDGYISAEEAARAKVFPVAVRRRAAADVVQADYFAEEVRRELVARYGENALYKGGLSVRTTVDPRLQEMADRALRNGLETYDRRHGWRGPITRLDLDATWRTRLADVEPPPDLGAWRLALVLEVTGDAATVGFANGGAGQIPTAELAWARPWLAGQRVGRKVKRPADVLAAGDVVAVAEVTANAEGELYPIGTYGLRQIPAVDGAIVALDPHTGRVLAMSGGYDHARSQYNRVTQAWRQPGSAFKPFVYLAALDSGFTPVTLILDAPFVIDQGPGLPKWRPANYTNRFYGPSTMRLGVEKSRNLMTVRLAQTVGMEKVATITERFGVVDHLPRRLSMALGAGETTLMRLTTGYAMLVNGGRRITPTLIDRIQDRQGRTIFRHDDRACADCRATFWTGQAVPAIADARERVTDPGSAYQLVSMLEGVIERGTGRRVRTVGRPIAGKTGTTNDSFDAWFIGFSPDLAIGVFVGFDGPQSLGPRETGSSVAAPIFRDFAAAALAEAAAVPFRVPPGIRLVRVKAGTGEPALPGDDDVILEAFKPGSQPDASRHVLEGLSADGAPATGTGGLY